MKFFLFCLSTLFFIGCSSVDLQTFNEAYYGGNMKKAYDIAHKGANLPQENQKHKSKSDDLLWQVQGGIAGFYGDIDESRQMLLTADRMMQDAIKNFAIIFFGNLGAVLTSDNVLPYPIYLYEASMVNYYLALDSMNQGKDQDARVYLNQALQRQNDAKFYYAREIEKSQESLNNMKNVSSEAPKTDQYVAVTMDFARESERDREVQDEKKYINPIIPYLKFIFELKRQNFSAIASMSADDFALFPLEDKEILESRKSGDTKRYIWVIIEDGKSASKGTLSFSIPLPMNPEVFLNPAMLAIALSSKEGALFTAVASNSILLNYVEPKVLEGISFAKSYSFENKEIPEFFVLSDLMKTEFDTRIAGVRTRAILRSIPPAIGAFISERAGNEAGFNGLGLLFSLGHKLILRADTRIITALPHSFYVTRMENTKDKKKILVDGRDLIEFQTKDQSQDAIVYIRNLGSSFFIKVFE
ncbi:MULTISPECIES: hypothetical protein [unclassified Helicobacter]|uniref:hypothetical protein n=1 Tax=unclassified Helicobacter TaxID=2593540 RepID=UPI000CF08D59|nr:MULTISPECIES: hypothetical protein [unclassified Helicobacter]